MKQKSLTMMTKMELSNFQCHEHISLDFVPGVNVITGSSDIGKSALLKGLLWIITNKPQGIAFRRMQAKRGDIVECKIIINDHEIIRRRSEHINDYIMDGKKFVAMKGDVPIDIAAVLDLRGINIQTQFQPHYLLSASSGDVAKALNESCDLSIIDQTIKSIKSIENSAKNEAKYLRKNIEETQRALKKLDWVDTAEMKIHAVTAEVARINTKKRTLSTFSKIADMLRQVDILLQKKASKERAFKKLSLLDAEMSKLFLLYQDKAKITQITNDLQAISLASEKLSKIRSFQILPGIEQDIAKIATKKEQLKSLLSITNNLKKMTREKEAAIKHLYQTENLLAQFKSCPLCGANIKED